MSQLLPVWAEKEAPACVWYFAEVSNATAVREACRELGLTALDADAVASLQHVWAAVERCVLDASRGTMLARSRFAEVLNNLGPSRKVSSNVKVYGVTDQTKRLVVVMFDASDQGRRKQADATLAKVVKGQARQPDALLQDANVKRLVSLFDVGEATEPAQVAKMVITQAAVKHVSRK